MNTLTDLVVIIIEMMEGEEQKAFLEKMQSGERPAKRPVPMTVAERWWSNKLGAEDDWVTSISVDDLVTDFIKGSDWKKSRHGARTSLGKLLKKLCPAIRLCKGNYIMPTNGEARTAFLEEFPAPKRRAGLSGITLDGVKVLSYKAID